MQPQQAATVPLCTVNDEEESKASSYILTVSQGKEATKGGGRGERASSRKLTSIRRTMAVRCCSRARSRADLPMSFRRRGSAAWGPVGNKKRRQCWMSGILLRGIGSKVRKGKSDDVEGAQSGTPAEDAILHVLKEAFEES